MVVGLLVAGLPAVAQDSNFAKPVVTSAARVDARQAAAKKPAARTPLAATAATAPPADDQTGAVTQRKGKAPAKGAHTGPVPSGYAALPETERLAIQSELAWLGDFDPGAGGDVDDRTIAAIKAFQKRHGGRETGVLTEEERAQLAAAVQGPEAAVGWRLIDDSATGARLSLPSKLVPQTETTRNGSRWSSAQGQIQIETFRLHEAALPALFEEEKKSPRQRHAEYSVLKPDSFVISGMQRLKKFIVRAQSSGSELRGITILYDQATEGTMDSVALAVSNTFKGFPDPNAGPPPGKRRSVEYATAIVVSSRGHLIAPARVAEECQSITVPGLGHAERIAEDKTVDLALLRLYGAQNLVPAALAGDNGKADELTLVGVADPLAQAGDGAVTRTAARLTAQGVEPAPKPGFSGAAAIDAQGRFAGVVELKSQVVAGAGSGSQQAKLVPADAVRAFLGAQAIALGTESAPVDKSVVRVICVRK